MAMVAVPILLKLVILFYQLIRFIQIKWDHVDPVMLPR